MNTDPPVLQKFESDLQSESIRSLEENKQTVGELWVGFLAYYAYEFDWKKNVVCIRKFAEPLTREQKNWTKNSICMAIEDPLELSRNLASGVNAKKSLYILKCFAKARSIFGMSKVGFKPDETNINYFFDPQSLVDGPPPMDNNCYFCFKIGHHARDCSLNKHGYQIKSKPRNKLLGQ
jgi:terminal uridylyltransferase